MALDRLLDLSSDLTTRSVFLFGPRQTGKTTLLRLRYPTAPWFSLLQGDVFLRLSANPGRLREELENTDPNAGPVVIDEIQKLPALLDDVHDLIERQGFRFVLTGSSPVKLRRGGTNLLGGRARVRELMPLVSAEIPEFDLGRALLHGTIPSIYLSDQPRLDLEAYCGTYLQLEVQAEGLVRGIEPFSRFLRSAARRSGEQIVFERVASEAQVPARTVREFYQVLTDTLLGVMLDPIEPGRRSRRIVSRGKFYLFDVGVAHALAGTTALDDHTAEYGRALEQLIFMEIRAWRSYRRDDRPFGFWRTTDGMEVDFLLGSQAAIEVKATANATRADTRGLADIAGEADFRRRILVCREPVRRIVDGIEILPIHTFLDELWSGKV
ncbi:MAG: ATP-binding protein [Spirochaetaceae bacterium]|nr:MAG: ATP-binding protein [Spirochaetaceae bacterium]